MASNDSNGLGSNEKNSGQEASENAISETEPATLPLSDSVSKEVLESTDAETEQQDPQEVEEIEEVDEVIDADSEIQEESGDPEASDSAQTKEEKTDDQTQKIDQEEKKEDPNEDDEEESEEAQKKIAAKFDPNRMPQVDVNTLGMRKWQVKVYPLRPSDFMSGQVSRIFKQARESLLYLYTAGNNGRYSNGKAELYMSNINQAVKVMSNLMKMDFFHPETNIRIIRKDDSGVVVEKAWMRFDTKMASHLFQHPGSLPRAGTKRERVIGSVFLKNLPEGATKDMLRVMFPFASEINFNPEKFKESTARLVLSNRNNVIPCLKAFSKVELKGNILELRPLEKRKQLDDNPEKDPKSESSDKSSSPSKETKPANKKDDDKSSSAKETESKGTEKDEKDKRKPGPGSAKRNDPKRPRGGNAKGGAARGRGPLGRGNSRSGQTYNKSLGGGRGKHSQQQQRWQDRRSSSSRGGRGRSGFRGSSGSHYGDRDSARSPGRSVASMGRQDGAEVTHEMMHLQAQLSAAIKNQISMLNQTQLAVEQAKRGAAVAIASAQSEQYNRLAEIPRRTQAESSGNNRQRLEGRRARDRRENYGMAEKARANRGRAESRSSGSFGGKRTLSRTSLDTDNYDDVSFPKRSNLSFGGSSGLAGRSWAEETEDLDIYRADNRYRDQDIDYTESASYASDPYTRGASSSGRSFGGAGYSLDYAGDRAYDYGY